MLPCYKALYCRSNLAFIDKSVKLKLISNKIISHSTISMRTLSFVQMVSCMCRYIVVWIVYLWRDRFKTEDGKAAIWNVDLGPETATLAKSQQYDCVQFVIIWLMIIWFCFFLDFIQFLFIIYLSNHALRSGWRGRQCQTSTD